MQKTSYRFRDLCSVAALSGLVVAAFWLILPSQFNRNDNHDFLSFYGPVARNLIDGHGFVLPDGRAAILYPPGFALYVAGLFAIARFAGLSENTMLLAGSLLTMAVGAALIYCIANLYWSRKEARLAALAWTTYPLALWLTKQPSAEAPFTVLLYGAVLIGCRELARSGRYAAWMGIGALAGLAMLVRPVAVGIPLVFAALLLFKGMDALPRRVLLAGCMIATAIVVISPWEAWLYRTQNRFILLGTIGGPTMRDGIVFGVHLKGYRDRIPLPADVEQMMLNFEARRGELTTEKAVFAALADYFGQAPAAVVKLFGIKSLRSWYATDSRKLDLLLIPVQLGYLALVLLATVGAWRGNVDSQLLAFVVWGMVGYFWAMNTISAAIVRYMVPAFGLLLVNLPGLWVRMGPVVAPARFEISETIILPETSQV